MADITYIPTDEGWLYLAAVKDLHTCEIVGMDERMTNTILHEQQRGLLGQRAHGEFLWNCKNSMFTSLQIQNQR